MNFNHKKKEKTENFSKKIEASQNYLQDLIFFFPLPLCFVSPSGVILKTNSALNELLNYQEGELIDTSLEKLLKKPDFEKILEETLEKGFIKNLESILKTKENKEIPSSLYSQLRRDEKKQPIGFFLIFFDLRKIQETQKQLEEKTKDLEKTKISLLNILEDMEEARRTSELEQLKTRAIINNLIDGVLFFDNEGVLQIINPAAKSILGLKEENLIGKTIEDLEKDSLLVKIIQAAKGQQKDSVKEIAFSPDQIFELSSAPVSSETENLGFVINIRDVSRERRVERLKSEFVTVAAHQLRTPLSAIKWTLKMFLEGDLGQLTPNQLDFIEKLYLSNERMIELVNDLLNVARIEEGRQITELVPASLESLCQEVIDSFKYLLEKKNIIFGFLHPAEKLPLVKVDRESIKLVIHNLLDNAIKYTPVGGQITIILTKKNDEFLEFQIKDTGFGIPKDQQNRVFSRFFRGANIIKLETEGTGLGLFIVKNIVEAHGGRVWFESEEGKGTTFYFTLPTLRPEKTIFEKIYKKLFRSSKASFSR
jgi:PAS domain S-box-containing protein